MKKSRPEPYLDTDIADIEGEYWDSVVGFDGYYSVSNMGRIKSEKRMTRKGYYTKEIIKKQCIAGSNKHLKIGLNVDGIKTQMLVSNIVADAFLRERNDSEVVHFKNLNNKNCRLSNLTIISRSEMLRIYAAAGHMPHLVINNQIAGLDKLSLSKFGVYDGEVLVGRICNRCFVEKDLDKFPSDGRLSCKECEVRKSGVVDVGKLSKIKELKEAGLKKCPRCQIIKKIDTEFYKGCSRCAKCQKNKKNAQSHEQ